MGDFWKAESDIVDMANDIIKEFRPELASSEIAYIFREKAGKRGGKVVIATARKASKRDNVIYSLPDRQQDLEFVITIGASAWVGLSPDQKRAVLHHELCHCGYVETKEGDQKAVIIPHDLEEFGAVVQAHGFYLPDVLSFASTCRNMKVTETPEG